MPSFTASILATSFLTLSLTTAFQPVALSSTPVNEPILIAAIEDKVRELVSEGNSYLLKGDPRNVTPKTANNASLENNQLLMNNGMAIQSFDKALRLNPENRDALYGKGLAHLQLYLLKDHIPSYMTLMPVAIPPTFSLLSEAINNLGAVTKIDPSFVPVYLELGRALLLDNNYEHSIQANQFALKLGTKEPWRAHSNIGMAYYHKMLQNPARPQGPKMFYEAKTAWEKAITIAENEWFAYHWLGEMHRIAHDDFGYDGASKELANYYSQQAKVLYDQTPQGRREQAQQQQQQRQQQAQYSLQQREQARQQSWRNRPCSPYPDALRRHMCQEGYLNPNSVQGANQPMPPNW